MINFNNNSDSEVLLSSELGQVKGGKRIMGSYGKHSLLCNSVIPTKLNSPVKIITIPIAYTKTQGDIMVNWASCP